MADTRNSETKAIQKRLSEAYDTLKEYLRRVDPITRSLNVNDNRLMESQALSNEIVAENDEAEVRAITDRIDRILGLMVKQNEKACRDLDKLIVNTVKKHQRLLTDIYTSLLNDHQIPAAKLSPTEKEKLLKAYVMQHPDRRPVYWNLLQNTANLLQELVKWIRPTQADNPKQPAARA